MPANQGAFVRSFLRPLKVALERTLSDAAVTVKSFVLRQPLSTRALSITHTLAQPTSRIVTKSFTFDVGQPQTLFKNLLTRWVKSSRIVKKAFGAGKGSCRRLYAADGVGLGTCLAFLPGVVMHGSDAKSADEDPSDLLEGMIIGNEETDPEVSAASRLIGTMKHLRIPVKKDQVIMSNETIAKLLNGAPASKNINCKILPRAVVRHENAVQCAAKANQPVAMVAQEVRIEPMVPCSPSPVAAAADIIGSPATPTVSSSEPHCTSSSSAQCQSSLHRKEAAAPRKHLLLHSPRTDADRLHSLETERKVLREEKNRWIAREAELTKSQEKMVDDRKILEAQLRSLQRQLDLALLEHEQAEAKLAELESSHSCVVCMDAPRNVLYPDCGHLVVCADCDMHLLENSAHDHYQCPMCRSEVTSKILHQYA